MSILIPELVHFMAILVTSVVSVNFNPSTPTATDEARSPRTVSVCVGVAVPIPTFPPVAIMEMSPVEDMELMARVLPVKAVSPALPIVPVVTIASAPVSMAPKPVVMEPELRAPTAVREELKMPEPRVVAERTEVPAIE